MFAWVRKLFRQTVNWFRPENGGHALTIPVHPCPPRSAPVNLGPSLSIPKITHAEIPTEPETAPASAPEEPPRHVAEPKEPPPALKEEILIEVANRLTEAEQKLELPPAPELSIQERVARVEGAIPTPKRPHRERDQWLHPIHKPHKPRDPSLPPKPRKPRTVIELDTDKDPDEGPWLHHGDKPNEWDLRRESEDSGVFYFRKDLLDRLDLYFRAIARMKKAHRDAYDLYTQMGGTMVPHAAMAAVYELPAFWHTPKNRPAFGCVHFGDRDVNSMMQMIYFEKMSRPSPDIEQAPGADVYEVTTYLDDVVHEHHGKSKRMQRWLRNCGFVFQFWIAVEPNGDMRPLKTLQTEWENITYRAGTSRYGKTRKEKFGESIPHKFWAYPYNLRWWWKEADGHRKPENRRRHNSTIEEWACSTLRLLANFAQSSELAVRVSVENELHHHAVFALDWKRTSYFFKDRDTVLTPKGKAARIFHIVKPHLRKKADGTETAVHLHFRGLRRFKWGKYGVHITVPGLHHIPMSEFTVGMEYLETIPLEERKHTYDTERIGRELGAHLDERKALGELFK